jgi:hypothetical protein
VHYLRPGAVTTEANDGRIGWNSVCVNLGPYILPFALTTFEFSAGVGELSAEDDVRVLLGIARLGEADLAGWWNTRLFTRAGRFVLSRSFPRTWKPAGGQLLILSCARWHNHAFSGRPSAIHLYSPHLPALGWAHAWLAEQKTTVPIDPLFDELVSWTDVGDATKAIDQWLPESAAEAEVVAGNLCLGTVNAHSLRDPAEASAVVEQLAKHYVPTANALQIPYFDAV